MSEYMSDRQIGMPDRMQDNMSEYSICQIALKYSQDKI